MVRFGPERVAVGDVLEVVGHRLGEHARFAEVIEVIGDARAARYRVRWDDGRESIVYPSSDVVVRPHAIAVSAGARTSRSDAAAATRTSCPGSE